MYTITNDTLSNLTFRVEAESVNEAVSKVYPSAKISFAGLFNGTEGLTRLWIGKDETDIIKIYEVVRYF